MSRVVAPVSFDGAAHFGATRLRMLDRVSQFALVAAAEAIADAGALFERDDRDTTGVFVGTGMGGSQTTDEGYQTVYEERSDRVKPYTVLMAMNNAAAAWIGIDHHLLRPEPHLFECLFFVGRRDWRSVEAHCVGEFNVMLAGGSEAPLTFGTLKAWEALKTLAMEGPDDVSASCKPFAKNRSGLVLGEGQQWSTRIVGSRDRSRRTHSCRTCGLWPEHGCGAHHPADRRGPGACDDSRAGKCAHRRRRRGLCQRSAGPQRWRTMPWRLLRSTGVRSWGLCLACQFNESMHGHLLGAAGALELVATVLAIEKRVLPPTLHLVHADPECDLDYVVGSARPVTTLDAAISDSFALVDQRLAHLPRIGIGMKLSNRFLPRVGGPPSLRPGLASAEPVVVPACGRARAWFLSLRSPEGVSWPMAISFRTREMIASRAACCFTSRMVRCTTRPLFLRSADTFN